MLGSGTTLNDRYLLTDRVGGGGMGEVWRATDTVLGRTVAVKVLMPALSEDAAFQQRFRNEARAMATLRHPGVVDVYDYGACEVGGRRVTYLVMAFVEGESLDKRLRRAPLAPEATMLLVAEVAGALAAAHDQGIVHRDVKPANLIVRTDGSVALTDFGIAHSASAGQLTATGAMLCSAGYCAPEMATTSRVTPAADVYALGVVAYECLTGRLPFEGETPVQIIYKHLHAPVPPLPPEVPRGPREVVARALEKAPDRRHASATDLARAARAAAAEPDAAPATAPTNGPATPAYGPAATPAIGPASTPPYGPDATPANGPGATPAYGPDATPAYGPSTAPAAGSTGAPAAGTAGAAADVPPTMPAATQPPRRRQAVSAALAMALAVLVTAGVAAMVWMRPAQTAQPNPLPPPVTTSEQRTPATHTERPTVRGKHQSPGRPTRTPSATASGTPSPSVTPTVTDPPTDPPTTPGPGPTTEPEPEPSEEPTQEPTDPGPQEPTPEPTVGKPTDDIQCVRAPCP